mmetsp:Transcript_18634/g.38268  ORF Transcript_18634/g.38268 Transcript_18634/m.38268 type:complete len:207 (-) Transcript_18634:380-1000(-)
MKVSFDLENQDAAAASSAIVPDCSVTDASIQEEGEKDVTDAANVNVAVSPPPLAPQHDADASDAKANDHQHDDDDDDDNHPAEEIIDDFRICHLFERSKSAAAAAASFTHPVPSSRISTSNDPPDGNSRHRVDVRRVLSEALARVPLTSLEAYHPEEKTPPLRIYDYVDHVSNFGVDGAEGLGRRDWLENRAVASFVDDFDVGKMG